MPKVAILGSGPTGLLAAATAVEAGYEVKIYSQKVKSKLYGAQYLHAEPPMVYADRFEVDYQLWGKAEDYRQKVYSGGSPAEVSPERFSHPHTGWDIRGAYDRLWDVFEDHIVDFRVITFDQANTFIRFPRFDYVFSSLPRTVWSAGGEKYTYQNVLAKGSAKDDPMSLNLPDNTVICNGNLEPAWYRASHIAGYSTLEWPDKNSLGQSMKIPLPGVVKVKKPLSYSPSDHRINHSDTELIHIGRYGEWKKGVLTSDAVDVVKSVLGV